MPDEEKKSKTSRVSDKDRFRYIGFEVFPGKPKDLFKSDNDRSDWISRVKAKRDKGEVIRDECTLLEERVSMADRITLIVACLAVFVTLFIPWFGVYNEIEETAAAAVEETEVVPGAVPDTMAPPDSGALLAAEHQAVDSATGMVAETTEEPDLAATETSADEGTTESGVASEQRGQAEEVIHGYVAKKKMYKDYARVSALGSLISLGSIGSYVFSSGGVLILTAIVVILSIVLCVALPAYTLYGLFGGKGSADEKALHLKKALRLNWLPLVLFVVMLVLSFIGADYGFDSQAMYTSLGDSYSVGVFLDTLSWGVIVSLAAFILMAAKGVEI